MTWLILCLYIIQIYKSGALLISRDISENKFYAELINSPGIIG